MKSHSESPKAPDPTQELLLRGLELQKIGQLSEAEGIYRKILKTDNNHSSALYFLGLAKMQMGSPAEAEPLFAQAARVDPRQAEALMHQGIALGALGRFGEARAPFAQVIELQPTRIDAYVYLADAFRQELRFEEAVAVLKRALSVDVSKEHPGGHHASVHFLYAQCMCAMGEPEMAIEHFETALTGEDRPEIRPEIQYQLAVALGRSGRTETAIAECNKLIAAHPTAPAPHVLASSLYRSFGNHEAAAQHSKEAMRIAPELPQPYANLAVLCKETGRFSEAILLFEKALALQPQGRVGAETLTSLGVTYLEVGRAEEAAETLRRAVELVPTDVAFWSNWLGSLQYLELPPAERSSEHQRWGALVAGQHSQVTRPNKCSPAHERLRIGYLSGDFRDHAVANFFRPLIAHHDRNRFALYAYSSTQITDEATLEFKQSFAVWRDVVHLSDQRLAETIRNDEIDVLIELSGHTAGNRLLALALRPAPLQITYLGYPSTTGLSAIDYRFTDDLSDPTEHQHGQPSVDELYSERLWRLPRGFLAYAPPRDLPEVAPPPSAKNGFVTFGSFNNIAKLSPTLIELWSALLQKLPEARLLLKAAGLCQKDSHDHLRRRFADRGADVSRIDFLPYLRDKRDHLGSYAQIDVALDTFPYHGTTTTCEALLMGVPVVTLSGSAHVSRVGVSLLSTVGYPEWIADTKEQYLAKACELGSTSSRLSELRKKLRQELCASPLCDGPGFTREFEKAILSMWAE